MLKKDAMQRKESIQERETTIAQETEKESLAQLFDWDSMGKSYFSVAAIQQQKEKFDVRLAELVA